LSKKNNLVTKRLKRLSELERYKHFSVGNLELMNLIHFLPFELILLIKFLFAILI